MKQYLSDLKFILRNGEKRDDRTGTGTIGVFGLQTRYDLRAGFPAVTTKKLAWRQVVSELLWFIEGSGDERRLAEILHGTRDQNVKTIWTDNANAPYWKGKAEFEGDLGRVYGTQWRAWRGKPVITNADPVSNDGKNIRFIAEVDYEPVDQLMNLIDGIKKDPYGRRHVITAWDPGQLDKMALPPCHLLAQFYVSGKGELSCQMYQRSADFFLGVPFNIASYSLLTHMVAHVCDLKPGEFIHTIGDAHLYLNHLEQVKEQLARDPLEPTATLRLSENVTDIRNFSMDDVELLNYESHPAIKAPMAV